MGNPGAYRDFTQTTWDAAQRQGSKGIFVWESTDLVNWSNERLVVVENSSAGMVWAPEAIWDAAKGQYLVHWASKFVSPPPCFLSSRLLKTNHGVHSTPPQTRTTPAAPAPS